MIPPSVKNALAAARAVALAHLDRKRAWEHEASERVMAEKSRALQQKLDTLVETLSAMERDLSSMKKAAGIDWSGIARTLGGFAKIVREAKGGTLTGQKVQDWIEGEIVDFERGPRPRP